MKQEIKTRAFFLLTLSLAGFLSGMRTYFLFSDFSPEKQHFLTPQYEAILLLGFCLSFLFVGCFCFLFDRNMPLSVPKKPTRLVCELPLVLLFTALTAYDLALLKLSEMALLEWLFFLIAHALFAAAAVCYLLRVLGLGKGEGFCLLSRAIPALSASFYAIYLYFEGAHFMNNPNLLLLQGAFLALSLYEIALARAELWGRRSRRFLFASSVAAILLFATAIPSLLYSLFRGGALVTGILPDLLLLFYAIRISAGLYPAAPISAESGTEEPINSASESEPTL